MPTPLRQGTRGGSSGLTSSSAHVRAIRGHAQRLVQAESRSLRLVAPLHRLSLSASHHPLVPVAITLPIGSQRFQARSSLWYDPLSSVITTNQIVQRF